jgi:CHRD domain
MRFPKRALLLAPVFVLAVGFAALPSVTLGDNQRDFKARLDGYHEVIPAGGAVNTNGVAMLRTRLSNDSITFHVEFSGLTSKLIFAHYHFGQKFTTGGVMVFLCGGGGQPACPAATSGVLDGTITAANVVGPAGQNIQPGDLASVLAAIRNDAAYINMHTDNFPAGEIRAQLVDRD